MIQKDGADLLNKYYFCSANYLTQHEKNILALATCACHHRHQRPVAAPHRLTASPLAHPRGRVEQGRPPENHRPHSRRHQALRLHEPLAVVPVRHGEECVQDAPERRTHLQVVGLGLPDERPLVHLPASQWRPHPYPGQRPRDLRVFLQALSQLPWLELRRAVLGIRRAQRQELEHPGLTHRPLRQVGAHGPQVWRFPHHLVLRQHLVASAQPYGHDEAQRRPAPGLQGLSRRHSLALQIHHLVVFLQQREHDLRPIHLRPGQELWCALRQLRMERSP